MRSTTLSRSLLLAVIGLLSGLSPLTFAQAVPPQEQVQVQASRVTSSLMLLRGEGFKRNTRTPWKLICRPWPLRCRACRKTAMPCAAPIRNWWCRFVVA